MTTTREEFLLTLRNIAEARSRNVEPPRMLLAGEDQTAVLDEVAADAVELDDVGLVRRWLAADETRTFAYVSGVPTLVVVDEADHALEVTDGRLVVPSAVRTALEADLEE